MRLQRTIKKEIVFSGIGLHTGRYATVKIKPAARDAGIVFYRVDKGALIRANIESVIDTAFATTIGYVGVKIKTVEHLLSAAAGLGIDNLLVEVDGPEVPILDGSSMELTRMIMDSGIAKQGKKMPFIKIINPIIYEDSHARVVALPYDGMRISYCISFSHQLLGRQELTLDITESAFVKEISPARTFGFLRDAEMMRANGLAKGGSLDNVVIVGDNGILNKTGLRFSDEFVRHKILDSIGDISLVGYPIQGHIILEKAGHTANLSFLKKLVASPDCYSFVSESELDHAGLHALNYS